MICPNCGRELPDTARVCPSCNAVQRAYRRRRAEADMEQEAPRAHVARRVIHLNLHGGELLGGFLSRALQGKNHVAQMLAALRALDAVVRHHAQGGVQVDGSALQVFGSAGYSLYAFAQLRHACVGFLRRHRHLIDELFHLIRGDAQRGHIIRHHVGCRCQIHSARLGKACRLLKARRQGYYEYQARKGSPREVRDRCLTVKIKNIFYESNRIYGSRKICAELHKMGECVSRKRVRRLISMSENAIGMPLAPMKKILKNQKEFRPICRMI